MWSDNTVGAARQLNDQILNPSGRTTYYDLFVAPLHLALVAQLFEYCRNQDWRIRPYRFLPVGSKETRRMCRRPQVRLRKI